MRPCIRAEIEQGSGKWPDRGADSQLAHWHRYWRCSGWRADKQIYPGICFEDGRKLEAQHDSELGLALASCDVGMATYDQERIGIVVDQFLYVRKLVQRLAESGTEIKRRPAVGILRIDAP
jgi:hypothetical protein